MASVVGHRGRAATPGAPPARPGAQGDGQRPARPARPHWPARCPSAKEPAAARGRCGQAGDGGDLGALWLAGAGGEEGGGGALLLACAVRCVRPTLLAVANTGITCALSNAIEIMQPGLKSDSLHNMPNICRIGKNMQYAEDVTKYAEYVDNMQVIH